MSSPIFGPPWSHPTLSYKAHFVSASHVRSSPKAYIEGVKALLEAYHLDIAFPSTDDGREDDSKKSHIVPLVINTMGWTKGLGADLIRQVEEIVKPTDIFDISASADAGSSLRTESRVYALEPILSSSLTTHFTAASHRDLSIMSYFHANFPHPSASSTVAGMQQATAESWNTALPLCARRPYEVDWAIAFQEVILIGAEAEDVVPGEISKVLNGAIVALVACENASSTSREHVLDAIPYTQGSEAPLPSLSSTVGLALIRSLSPESTHLHLLTPIPPAYLMECTTLIKGEMELPIWGMLDHRIDQNGETSVPYLQWGKGEGLGSDKRRVRRNLMRKGQM